MQGMGDTVESQRKDRARTKRSLIRKFLINSFTTSLQLRTELHL
jgi:hypothetical protein